MGVNVRELLHENGRVVGVRADAADGTQIYRADLVIGTDGRHSSTRKEGGFEELKIGQNFDVVWLKVPFPDFWPDRATVRLELGKGYISGGIPSSDGQLLTGFTIPKGRFPELRLAVLDAWTDEILGRLARTSPIISRTHEIDEPDCALGRDRRASDFLDETGAIALGRCGTPDVSHRRTRPERRLRDALVAANHLCPVLSQGESPAAIDAAADQVARERMPEIIALQEHQDKQAKLFLEPRLLSHLAISLLPLLLRTRLLPLMLGKRLLAFQHGIVPVRLVV